MLIIDKDGIISQTNPWNDGIKQLCAALPRALYRLSGGVVGRVREVARMLYRRVKPPTKICL